MLVLIAVATDPEERMMRPGGALVLKPRSSCPHALLGRHVSISPTRKGALRVCLCYMIFVFVVILGFAF